VHNVLEFFRVLWYAIELLGAVHTIVWLIDRRRR
jgi:hypothetical protein